MKSLFEIKKTLDLIKESSRGNPFARVEIQTFEWAFKTIRMSPLSIAEKEIRRKLTKLQEKQASTEIMAFATKPARAKQIAALKWVLDEGEI